MVQTRAQIKSQEDESMDVDAQPEVEAEAPATADSAAAPPPAKKRKMAPKTGASSAPKTGAKSRRRLAGKLEAIMRMPLDIFAEIAMLLHPLDLLHLSRTSHELRNTLMTRNNRFIWVESFRLIEGLPAAPESHSEPQYAAFLFESVCSNKQCTKRVLKADWGLMLRCCKPHYKECLTPREEITDELRKLYFGSRKNPKFDLKSYVRDPESIDFIYSYLSKYDYERFVQNLKNATAGGRSRKEPKVALHQMAKVAKEQREYIEGERKRSRELKDWHREVEVSRLVEKKRLELQRAEEIEDRLRARGWDERDIVPASSFPYGQDEYEKLVYKPTGLTDYMWNKILPELEAILQKRKDERLEHWAKAERKRRLMDVHECMIDFAWHNANFIEVPTQGRAASGDSQALIKEIARLTAEYAPTGTVWPCVEQFLEVDGPEPTKAAFGVLPNVQRDVRELEMRVRENLASLIRRSWHDDDFDSDVLQNWDAWKSSRTFEELVAGDEENLDLLLDPSSLFVVKRRSSENEDKFNHVYAYPGVLRHIPHLKPEMATEELRFLGPRGKSLAAKLGFGEETSVWSLEDRKFTCMRCPLPLREGGWSWRYLVSHVNQCRDWYRFLEDKHIEPLAPDTHGREVMDVVDFLPEHQQAAAEAYAAADAADASLAVWRCKLCPIMEWIPQILDWSHMNPLQMPSAKKWLIGVHMKEVHGLEGEAAEEHMTQWEYAQGLLYVATLTMMSAANEADNPSQAEEDSDDMMDEDEDEW